MASDAGSVYVDIKVRGLEKTNAEIDRVTRDRKVKVETDFDGKGAEQGLNRIGQSASSAIPNVRLLTVALSAIGPVAIPGIAAAGAGLIALSTAAGAAAAAVGVGALAFHGIGDAVKALGEASSASSKAVQKVGENAYQAAQRAYAIRDAARAVTYAEQGVVDAQQRSLRAQLDLNQARKDAARYLDDLNDRLKDSQLNEAQANLDVMAARKRLSQIAYDPRVGKGSVEALQAQLDLDKALQNQKESRKEATRTAAERRDALKKGINGSDGVKSAQQALLDAKKAQVRAEQDVTRAKEQQYIAQLRDKVAVTKTTAEVDKLKEAMDRLGPAGQHFARYIFSLEPEIKKLKRTAEDHLLPGVEKSMKEILTPATWKRVDGFVASVADSMSDVAIDWAKSLGDPAWQRAFKTLEKTTPHTIKTLGDIGTQVGEILAGIYTAASPAGQKLLDDLDDFLTKFSTWVNSPEGQKKLKKFFDDAVPAVEAMGRLAVDILKLFGDLSTNKGFTDFVNGLDKIVNFMDRFTKAHPDAVEAGLWGIFAALIAIKSVKIAANAFEGISTLAGAVGVGKKGLGSGGQVKGIGKVSKGFMKKFPKTGKMMGKLGKGGLVGIVATTAAGFAGDAIQDGHKGARDAGGGALSGAATGASIGALVGSIIPGIGTAIGAAIGGLVGGIWGAWNAVGTDGVKGFFKGIWDKLKDFGHWVGKKLDKYVIDPVKAKFGIKSPSTVFVALGRDIIQGLWNGFYAKLTGMGAQIGRWMNTHIIQKVTAFFGIAGGVASRMISTGTAIASGLAKGLYDKLVSVGSQLGGWLDKNILKPIQNAASKAGSAIGGIVTKGKNAVTGGGGGAKVPVAPQKVSGNQRLVKNKSADKGWGGQWDALYQLVMHESGFRNTAQNPSSTAYGMFQFLNSTWSTVGGHKTSDPGLQADYGLKYIQQKYGNPNNAWAFWQKHHWYDSGGILKPGMTMAMNGTGRPEAVLTDRQWKDVASYLPTEGKAARDGATYNIFTDSPGLVRKLDRREQMNELRQQLLAR